MMFNPEIRINYNHAGLGYNADLKNYQQKLKPILLYVYMHTFNDFFWLFN